VLLVTIPGEALIELGFEIRADGKELGFDHVILAGYSNDHLGYFAPPRGRKDRHLTRLKKFF
jgi:hypothetical protein